MFQNPKIELKIAIENDELVIKKDEEEKRIAAGRVTEQLIPQIAAPYLSGELASLIKDFIEAGLPPAGIVVYGFDTKEACSDALQEMFPEKTYC